MNACNSDLCQQGKRPCPCPMACELSDEDEASSFWRDLAIWGAATAIAMFFVAGVVALLVGSV